MAEQDISVTRKDISDDERITAYMRGMMSKDEESAFLEDVNRSAELRRRAIAMGYLAKAIDEVGTERDGKLKDALMSANEDDIKEIVAKTIHKTKATAIRRKLIYAMSAAATVLILIAVGYQYHDYRHTTGLGKEYASAFVSEQRIVRGEGNETVVKELNALYANVSEGKDLDATIKRLTVLWEVSTLDTYNDYTNYAPLIGWNLALANLKNNDKNATIVTLNQLIEKTQTGSAVNTKAKELLENIQSD